MGCTSLGSSVHGILQARILEQVAIPFSRGSSQPRDRTCISCIGRQVPDYYCHLGSPSIGMGIAFSSLSVTGAPALLIGVPGLRPGFPGLSAPGDTSSSIALIWDPAYFWICPVSTCLTVPQAFL